MKVEKIMAALQDVIISAEVYIESEGVEYTAYSITKEKDLLNDLTKVVIRFE